jgi:5-methylcytosine-specific restriction endonuclease McrA
MDYYKYITSSRWRHNPARLAELEAAGFRCRLCNSPRNEVQLEVHHRTYERLGYERADDLTTLCRLCHAGVTDMLRRRRYVLRRPRLADVIPAIENANPLFALSSKGDMP